MQVKEKAFAPAPYGFRMKRHQPASNSRAYYLFIGGQPETEIVFRLPGIRTELRMTRNEFEAMIRPALSESLGALQRALRDAYGAAGAAAQPADLPPARIAELEGGFVTAWEAAMQQELQRGAAAAAQATDGADEVFDTAAFCAFLVAAVGERAGVEVADVALASRGFSKKTLLVTLRGNAVLPATRFMGGLKFLNSQTMQQMLVFPDDMTTRSELAVNKLNNQQLVEYFEAEWNAYLQQ